MGQVIKQGVDCWVEACNIIDIRTGNTIDVTGYSVHAVARARYHRRVLGQYPRRWHALTPVISEWRTTPVAATDGLIIAGGIVPDRVQIHITPTQSSNWRSPLVNIQAEMTDPLTGEVARIIDEIYEISFEAVTT
jgi:hypothetical protein